MVLYFFIFSAAAFTSSSHFFFSFGVSSKKQLSLIETFDSTKDLINAFNFDLLDRNKIYHLEQIKKVSINYRLRFLDLKYFKNKLPESAHQDIQQLETLHETHLSGFKIMAPSALFRLEKADDPLLFAPLGNDFYYLVHMCRSMGYLSTQLNSSLLTYQNPINRRGIQTPLL